MFQRCPKKIGEFLFEDHRTLMGTELLGSEIKEISIKCQISNFAKLRTHSQTDTHTNVAIELLRNLELFS